MSAKKSCSTRLGFHGSNLKVLHAIQNLELGGGPASAVSLVNALAAKPELEMHFLARMGPMATRLSEQVSFHQVPDSRFILSRTRYVANLIRWIKPDVIHVHGARFALQVKAACWRTKWHCPIVVTQHSNGFRFVPDRLAGKLLDRVSSRVVALTEQSRDRLTGDGVTYSKISVIPHPFETIELSDLKDDYGRSAAKAGFGVDESQAIILVASRLVAGKGLHDFVRAVSNVHATNPDTVGLIAGAGPFSSELQKLANDSVDPDAVRFVGYQSDVKRLIGIADVVLFLSEEEVLPMFVVESMAYGIPVVARRIPAVQSLIEDGVSGILVNDVDQATDAVINLLNDADERSRIANSALQVVQERFATPVIVGKTISLYRHLT